MIGISPLVEFNHLVRARAKVMFPHDRAREIYNQRPELPPATVVGLPLKEKKTWCRLSFSSFGFGVMRDASQSPTNSTTQFSGTI